MRRHVEDARAGLDFEHRLFAASGPQVGIWSAREPGLVCPKPYERRPDFERAVALSRARGWPVHHRLTGGGTVPQGPGVDNLALAFDAPKGTTIEDGYRMLTEIIKRGLGEHGAALEVGDTLGSFCDGAWNLSFEGRKIVGTAQRWRPMPDGRRRVLAHALILTNPDIREATEAVSAFQRDLGLGLVDLEAHTSAGTAFHLTELPAASLLDAAEKALGVFEPMLLD